MGPEPHACQRAGALREQEDIRAEGRERERESLRDREGGREEEREGI